MKVEKRTESLKIVRGSNKIAGVLFGKTIEPISIQLDEKPFHDIFSEKGMTQTFEIKIGKAKHLVYIKDIQRDIIKNNQFLNVKLQKVSKDDTMIVEIPLNIVGREKVEKLAGVIVSLPMDSLEVEYNVGSGVANITVDVSKMQIGDSLSVKDLDIPEGLKVLDDPDQTVVSIIETTYVEEELDTEAEEVDPADVEVITEKKKKDEESN